MYPPADRPVWSTGRPYVVLSCAMSIDGYIDDASPVRLRLSSDDDFDRVDAERARCDAILIGAGTIRADNPQLLVRSADRRRARTAARLPENLVKVTITTSGDLDPNARFFTTGDVLKLVYCPDGAVGRAGERLGRVATVVGIGPQVDLRDVLVDLAERGVGRLMVEGGGTILTTFLASGLVDELQLAIAPFFVGEADAPRMVNPGSFVNNPEHPLRLEQVRAIGDVAYLRYLAAPLDG